MAKAIYVLNGPNLNRLGKREPEIYGSTTLAEVEAMCRKAAGEHPVEFRQSNAEFQLVDWIHEAIDKGAASSSIPRGSPSPRFRSSTR
jgi:3-dehydroquinate dehydratase-2